MNSPRVISSPALAAIAAWTAVLVGCTTLMGWALGIVRLTDWGDTGVSMMPNTAIAATLGGSAILAIGWRQRAMAAAAAAGTLLIGGATFAEHVFSVNLGIDTLLLHREWGQGAVTSPGRMGPPASLSYGLIGIAILLAVVIPPGRRARRGSVVLALFVAALAMLSLVGRLFGAQQLHSLPRLTAIALQTSVALLVLAIGVLALLADQQPMRMLTGRSSGSVLLRRAIPIIVLVPVLLGLLRVMGERIGYFDANFGSALRTILEILVLAGAMWWIARVVETHELALVQRRQEVREKSELIAAMADSSDDAIVGKTLDGVVTSWNRGAEQMFGYSATQAIGKQIAFLIPADRLSEEADVMARLRRGERVEPFDTERVTREGSRISVSISVSPVRDAEGTVIGAAKVARDITKRKRLEETLRQNHALFSALVEQAPQGVYVVDSDFRLQQINPAAAPAFTNVPDPIGKDFAEVMRILWGPEVGAQCVSIFRHTLETGEPFVSPPFSHERHDLKAEESYEWQTRRVVLPDGRYGVVCYFENVTDEVRAAAALRDSRLRAQLAVETSGVGIWEWNVLAGHVRWDAPMFGIYGVQPTPDGVIPYHVWSDAVLPEDLPEQERILNEAVRNRTKSSREFRIRRATDGEIRIVRSVEVVRTNDRNEVEWVVGTNLDITEQRRTERELEAQRQLLEERVLKRTADLERAQSELRRVERIASMGTLAAGLGHDLTNIMLPIRWRLESIEGQEMSPALRADFADIASGMGYLQRLAAGLRQMAANPDAAPPSDGTDLHEWWSESNGVFGAILARNIRLTSSISERCAGSALPRVHINRIGLTQAIFNLVQNASEALAPRGSGTISISARLNTEDEGASVLLAVTDDGPGMTPEVASRCFDPYFSTKGRAVSTGMGLSMVRGILETVGGSVLLHTATGAGTTFTLRIPVTPGSSLSTPTAGAGAHGLAAEKTIPTPAVIVPPHESRSRKPPV